jgi:hypothetical protein
MGAHYMNLSSDVPVPSFSRLKWMKVRKFPTVSFSILISHNG